MSGRDPSTRPTTIEWWSDTTRKDNCQRMCCGRFCRRKRLGHNTETERHLREAILIPVHELPARLGELEPFKEKTVVVYCRTGRRSGRATSLLNELGFRAFNMIGGMVQWNAEGRPAVREDGQ